MKTMKFIILSTYKMDAVENNCSEFLAEDLLEAIESDKSLIVTAVEHVGVIRQENPRHKFEYEIVVKKNEF